MRHLQESRTSAGKNPMGLAAAVLYLASVMEMEHGKMQSDIAKAAGVTEVTIRKRYKPLNAMEESLGSQS